MSAGDAASSNSSSTSTLGSSSGVVLTIGLALGYAEMVDIACETSGVTSGSSSSLFLRAGLLRH